MSTNTKWLSMRHFVTKEYQDEIYMGQQPYSICNTNIITNGLIEKIKSCTIFASPLKRSIQTVEYIVSTYDNTRFNVVFLDGLMERCLGDFEGKYKWTIRTDPKYFVNGKFIVTKTPPNGESIESFRKRVESCIPIMVQKLYTQNILVVSHLQTLRMIRFCVANSFDYDTWHNINYKHGEVVQEDYGKK